MYKKHWLRVVGKNPPFSGWSNRTEAKKDQYLDRNDYGAHDCDRTRMRSLALINCKKEQDVIFDGIMLTRLFSACSCHNNNWFLLDAMNWNGYLSRYQDSKPAPIPHPVRIELPIHTDRQTAIGNKSNPCAVQHDFMFAVVTIICIFHLHWRSY